MEEIKKRLERIVKELFAVDVEVSVTPAPENTGADYASNIAMQLAKVVHRPPVTIAQMIEGELEQNHAASSIEVRIAAPGFLNFRVSSDDVAQKVAEMAGDFAQSIKLHDYMDKTVVAEFSDPNPFKVLHVGHLYTSVVGDSISRLLECAGAKVVRANFGGDVGLHVAKTLYSVLATCNEPASSRATSSSRSSSTQSQDLKSSSFRASDSPRISSEITAGFEALGQSSMDEERLQKVLQELTIEDIAKCYVEGTRAYEEDEAAKEEITRLNKEIYRINAEDLHDGALAQLYWRGRELSYEYFDKFYKRIGVKFDKYYPESSVAERGVREVQAHTGTTYEESNGAIVYHGEKVGLHTRVFINAQSVPTYETKDVGLLFTKWDDWHFDESVVVTGNEQSDYMKVVLASVSEYASQLVERTTHLTHGLVKLPGNVKMSSRKGNFLKAVDVLQLVEDQLKNSSATSRIADNGQISASEDAMLTHGMSNTVRSASPSSLNSTHSEQSNGADEIQHRVALGAIKYAFLKYKMGGDIVFDPQESVSATGNSGVYLLYSAVRAKKILHKASGKQDDRGELTEEEQKYTKDLNKKIVQYREVLQEAVREKAPYKVCNYLYELAQEFSRFYEHVKVAGNACEAELMETVRAYSLVMQHGLEKILGIEVPEQM